MAWVGFPRTDGDGHRDVEGEEPLMWVLRGQLAASAGSLPDEPIPMPPDSTRGSNTLDLFQPHRGQTGNSSGAVGRLAARVASPIQGPEPYRAAQVHCLSQVFG